VGELAITGDHGLAEQPRTSQLVVADRRDPKPWLVPVSGFRRITAITARQDGTIVIGGADGELAAVTVDTWAQARLRERTRHPPRVSDDNLAWATYTADAITALCTLPDDRVVAASADGELTIVGDDDGVRLEVAGTVRSIAAHPDGHVLAIGYKRGGFAGQASVVAIVALDPVLAPSLRTPRLIDAARAVDAQRFEPEMLAVFADALEQHGAPPALPAHVRGLGAWRSCWIVDALLGRASAWT
ncbi:MAG: hypothetical protein NT062_27970, partial [Proteobacteria bacterium]|nr:hypothetical protein [Pseudomonadota bacterium]